MSCCSKNETHNERMILNFIDFFQINPDNNKKHFGEIPRTREKINHPAFFDFIKKINEGVGGVSVVGN